jgi:hypothetical protein
VFYNPFGLPVARLPASGLAMKGGQFGEKAREKKGSEAPQEEDGPEACA